jgi:hypothetical protein
MFNGDCHTAVHDLQAHVAQIVHIELAGGHRRRPDLQRF